MTNSVLDLLIVGDVVRDGKILGRAGSASRQAGSPDGSRRDTRRPRANRSTRLGY